MRLTDRILQAYLQDRFSIAESRYVDAGNGYRGVLLMDEETVPEAGWVYVPVSGSVKLAKPVSGQILVVLPESWKTEIPEEVPVIRIGGEKSAAGILNALLRCYRFYEDWEEKVLSIRDREGSVEEILKASLPVMGNPLMVLRSDLTLLCQAGCEELPEVYNVFTTGVENMDIINAILQDRAYLEKKDRPDCYWGPDYILGFRMLNRNILQGGKGIYCLCLIENEEPVRDHAGDLLEILEGHVKKVLLHQEISGSRRNDTLHQLFFRMLSDRTLDYVEASRQLSDVGWLPEHKYMCLVFHQAVAGGSNLPANTICLHVEEQFENAVSFSYDDSVVSFFNMTRLGLEKDDVASRLTPFVRDSYLQAGYSRIMEGHMNLRRQYVQSVLALDVGGRRQPHLWIHHFDQIAMTYIMEQITRRLPGSMLCHTGILQLKKMDEANGSEYINTLRTYLDEHQNVVHSANALFIHRSTLIYRLDKIKEVLESDLDDPEELLYLELSLRLLEREENR